MGSSWELRENVQRQEEPWELEESVTQTSQWWEDLTLGALKTTTWKRDRHRNRGRDRQKPRMSQTLRGRRKAN